MIYFLQEGKGGAIKIGYTETPERRVRQLQSASPRRLDLLLVLDGGKSLESELHLRFQHENIRGEWFLPSDGLLEFIESGKRQIYEDLNNAKAYCHLEKQRDGYSWVIDRCPYCGEPHFHGGGGLSDNPQDFLSHRVAHCLSGQGRGYILVEDASREG